MPASYKSIAGRALYLLLGVVLLLASVFVFWLAFAGDTKRTYRDRKTEKSFLYGAVVLAISGLGSCLLAFDKKKEWKPENEAIRPTGRTINKNTEVRIILDNYKIERLLGNSAYRCIKTAIIYHGEEKELIVYLADEADYDKIDAEKSLNICGELKEEVWNLQISNAKLIAQPLTAVT